MAGTQISTREGLVVNPPLTATQESMSNLGVAVATSTTTGVVKPDNSTITVSPDGTLTATAAPPPPSGMTQIAQQVLSSPAANVTFSAIPAGFSTLKLVITAQSSSGANDGIWMQANGDTAANYAVQQVDGSGATVAAAFTAPAAKPTMSGLSSSTFDLPTVVTLEIPTYAGTTFRKVALLMQANTFAAGTVASTNAFLNMVFWCWRNTAAINELVLGCTSGSNFIAGSVFTLYGLE